MNREALTPSHYIISSLALGGIAFGIINSPSQPLLPTTDNFILFAQTGITIEQETQISSGDIGSNNQIDIQQKVLVNGNLFADTLTIDKDTIINGNTTYNKLTPRKNTQLLGEQTASVALPIAEIPQIQDTLPGTQSLTFTGEGNTLPGGNYDTITLNKDATLTLTGTT